MKEINKKIVKLELKEGEVFIMTESYFKELNQKAYEEFIETK